MTYRPTTILLCLTLIAAMPLLMGAKGCGSGPAFSRSPAPDMQGTWDVAYDDSLGIRLTLGGAVYEQTLGAAGGAFTIDHEGQPITFNLDCARPEVLCPSEAWPASVDVTQRNEEFPHRMFVEIPRQVCDGPTVACEGENCNADNDDICMGEIVTQVTEHFGVIEEDGSHFGVLLGAGVVTNGINCALLGVSGAGADITSTGSAEEENWSAVSMDSGEVKTVYAGGCLWVGDPTMDGALEALVVGASVEFTTGFTATRR